MIHLVFTSKDMPPALNGKNGLLRMHWSKRSELKTKFQWLIKEQRPDPIKGAVTLQINNYCIRYMDWDNLLSRLKLIGDAMVKMRLLEDDSPKIITRLLEPKQIKVNKKDEVRLEFIFNEIG